MEIFFCLALHVSLSGYLVFINHESSTTFDYLLNITFFLINDNDILVILFKETNMFEVEISFELYLLRLGFFFFFFGVGGWGGGCWSHTLFFLRGLFGTFQALLFCLHISFGSLKVINSI